MTTIDEHDGSGEPTAIYVTLPGRTDEIKLTWTKDGCGSFVVDEVLFVVPIMTANEETGRMRFFRPEEPLSTQHWYDVMHGVRGQGFKGAPLKVVFNSEGVIQFTGFNDTEVVITLTYDETGLKGDVVGEPH